MADIILTEENRKSLDKGFSESFGNMHPERLCMDTLGRSR